MQWNSYSFWSCFVCWVCLFTSEPTKIKKMSSRTVKQWKQQIQRKIRTWAAGSPCSITWDFHFSMLKMLFPTTTGTVFFVDMLVTKKNNTTPWMDLQKICKNFMLQCWPWVTAVFKRWMAFSQVHQLWRKGWPFFVSHCLRLLIARTFQLLVGKWHKQKEVLKWFGGER